VQEYQSLINPRAALAVLFLLFQSPKINCVGFTKSQYLQGYDVDCIDQKEGTVFIKKALSWTPVGGYRIKPTKNKQKRKIEATPEVFAALDRQSKLQAANKLRLGELYRKDLDLVFCNEEGFYHHPNIPTRWFPKFCEQIGINRFTFHCLRHTHARHLLSSGEDISFVSRRLGHSDMVITYSTYFHLIPKESKRRLRNSKKDLSENNRIVSICF
jgi:integrase